MMRSRLIAARTIGSRGQAMVEFVIILSIISLICLGMLYSSRLLTFQFWAQQEARFIAFEQDWVAQMGGSDPIAKLENGGFFHRPPVIDKLPDTRTAQDDGGVPTLLTRVLPGDVEAEAKSNSQSSPLSVGRRLATRRTVDLPTDLAASVVASLPPVVTEALASERILPERLIWSEPRQQSPQLPLKDRSYLPGNELEVKLRALMVKAQLGEQICSRYAAEFRRAGFHSVPAFLAASDQGDAAHSNCVELINNRFPEHLLRNTDLRTVFQDYGEQLDFGVTPAHGFELALQDAVAEGFYSFFDTSVRNAFNDATNELSMGMMTTGLATTTDSGVLRMLASLRYLGSNIAMGMITAAVADLTFEDANSRDADAEKAAEDSLHDTMFVDASDPAGIGVNGYWLSLEYLPIPPFIDSMFPLMFDGVMRNALSLEGDQVDPLIEESNKSVEVRYQTQQGIQLSVARRYEHTNKTLAAKFYLVTQPWHITRQKSANSGYRELGDQDDSTGEETDEGVLRRRTFGFWLFPAQPNALVVPVLGVLGDELDISGALTAFQGFDSIINGLKQYLFDQDSNPLLKLFSAMDSLPIPGKPDMTFPQWPTVRPNAYPRSKEISGDKLAGKPRDFDDFVKEQRDNNPKADPEFY